MIGFCFQPKRWMMLLSVLVVSFSCGEPADRCAAPSRAEIEALELAAISKPPEIVIFRDGWISAASEWMNDVLIQNPPDTARSEVRKLALATLDDILHLKQAPELDKVAEFYRYRIDVALRGITSSPPESGAKVWKLYNHGFVVRTSGHCYAFDIFPGVGASNMSIEQMKRLAAVVEVLFVSHRHRDHANSKFAQIMLDLGKAVVINPDIWPENQNPSEDLIRLEGYYNGSAKSIEFQIFDGHQGDIPNNVYLVRTDGVAVMHTGDQYSRADLDSWITGFSENEDVDILLPNCWTMDIGRMVGEIKPKVVITGHENELGHMVYKRESYGKSYLLLKDLTAPYVMMTWGESYHYYR